MKRQIEVVADYGRRGTTTYGIFMAADNLPVPQTDELLAALSGEIRWMIEELGKVLHTRGPFDVPDGETSDPT